MTVILHFTGQLVLWRQYYLYQFPEIINHRLKHSLILEITDISRHSVGMIARAMSNKNTKDSLQNMDSETLAKLGKTALAQKASSGKTWKTDDVKEEADGQQAKWAGEREVS